MPDRHSRPAAPRATVAATTPSHGSPAPAITVTRSPSSVRDSRRGCTATTSASRPRSDTPTLVPPPSTTIGPPRATPQACAAARAPGDEAVANHRAAPPTRSEQRGASAISVWIAGSATAGPTFEACQRGQRVGARAGVELDPVARRELTDDREIRGDHGRDDGISAGDLP